jgi:hypothetical protein
MIDVARRTIRAYDQAMTEPASPRDIAAAWEPQRPGRRSAGQITDALVEPEWGGLMAAAALTEDAAAVFAYGEEIRVPDELVVALRGAFEAVEAVIEGHLTPRPLRGGEGMKLRLPKVERPSLFLPRGLMNKLRDDPLTRTRDRDHSAAVAEREALEALAAGEPHAFVATDLLWLDGQSLLDVPLQERKRLLGSVLSESHLVRVTTFVRSTSVGTLMTWGSLGFREISYRSANSRYLPGRENPDWAMTKVPEGPHEAATPTPSL